MKSSRFWEWLSASAGQNENARNELLKKFKARNSSSEKFENLSPPSWILETTEFHEWLSPEARNNTLWISSTAGFGKSVIAAFLTEGLKKQFPSALLASSFCKDKDGLREIHQLVRNFLYQLSRESGAVESVVQRIWETDKSIKDFTADTQYLYKHLFLPALRSLPSPTTTPVFVIIDGMNELPQDQMNNVLEFLELPQTLHRSVDLPSLRVVLTSQPIPHNNKLKDVIQSTLTAAENLDNIDLVLQYRLNMTVKDYFKKRNLDPVGYFREHSHGMFLWVTTIIEYLNAMDGEDELTEILSKPPSTITEVYHIVLVGLQRDYFPHELSWIKEIILWTVMAKRDMTMSEIEVAIRISREKYDRN
jgi:hypothetical protein